jgi:hypothetical protein
VRWRGGTRTSVALVRVVVNLTKSFDQRAGWHSHLILPNEKCHVQPCNGHHYTAAWRTLGGCYCCRRVARCGTFRWTRKVSSDQLIK